LGQSAKLAQSRKKAATPAGFELADRHSRKRQAGAALRHFASDAAGSDVPDGETVTYSALDLPTQIAGSRANTDEGAT
jgi:hypothetical protein